MATILVMCLTSCNATKQTVTEMAAESIVDPKTGTRVLVREYDTEPYAINVGGIAKARKAAKKKKAKELLENY